MEPDLFLTAPAMRLLRRSPWIRLPRISNFTDFNALERLPGIALSYVSRPEELTGSDLIILPGTKNTMGDLKWLRQNGLEAVITRMAGKGIPVIGVCGGFQMLGTSLSDPHGVEEGGTMRGMELLPIRTIFAEKKTRNESKWNGSRVFKRWSTGKDQRI